MQNSIWFWWTIVQTITVRFRIFIIREGNRSERGTCRHHVCKIICLRPLCNLSTTLIWLKTVTGIISTSYIIDKNRKLFVSFYRAIIVPNKSPIIIIKIDELKIFSYCNYYSNVLLMFWSALFSPFLVYAKTVVHLSVGELRSGYSPLFRWFI